MSKKPRRRKPFNASSRTPDRYRENLARAKTDETAQPFELCDSPDIYGDTDAVDVDERALQPKSKHKETAFSPIKPQKNAQ